MTRNQTATGVFEPRAGEPNVRMDQERRDPDQHEQSDVDPIRLDVERQLAPAADTA